jgi:hypothetical protein
MKFYRIRLALSLDYWRGSLRTPLSGSNILTEQYPIVSTVRSEWS